MKMTQTELRMIEAQYVAMVTASIEGKSAAVSKMLGVQARANVMAEALKESRLGER